ncbi:uncharacterized protein LOC111715330 [Eurytemora carolleeae]|uniref:uncharacterized protein LOC111715330 n=1 Tax=Eurytemora carolleeae TaxID=1294199 RepID=UPI000C78DDA6|nr:uncharacterized protein LOC111715330 [Eurytemora carolleeae]|eukprot:XP_023346420.1 uncharacterized protein LOC111715330 [Eurytemora affinis]
MTKPVLFSGYAVGGFLLLLTFMLSYSNYSNIKILVEKGFPNANSGSLSLTEDKCSCSLPQSKVDAVGGWIYSEATTRNHHVRFDDGLGKEILRLVLKNTPPKDDERKPTIGDIGAGVGQFGSWLQLQGDTTVDWTGYDGGSNVNSFCGKNVSLIDVAVYTVPKVCFLDASIPVKREDFDALGAPFDWVISIEVGEHIPAEYMMVYIDNLIRLSKYGIILSWAVVGQGGHGHVNEKSNQDIIKIMVDRSLVYLPKESEVFRSRVDRLGWLRNTLMVFSKVDGMDAL